MIFSDTCVAVIHNKTGNIYTVVCDDISDTTNAVGGDVRMVLYHNAERRPFVREYNEFWEKFTRVTDS